MSIGHTVLESSPFVLIRTNVCANERRLGLKNKLFLYRGGHTIYVRYVMKRKNNFSHNKNS